MQNCSRVSALAQVNIVQALLLLAFNGRSRFSGVSRLKIPWLVKNRFRKIDYHPKIMTHIKNHCIRFKGFVSATRWSSSLVFVCTISLQLQCDCPFFYLKHQWKLTAWRICVFGVALKKIYSVVNFPPENFLNSIVSALWELIFPLATRETSID